VGKIEEGVVEHEPEEGFEIVPDTLKLRRVL